MKRLKLITVVAFILMGCNSPLDKSIFEPLTIKELKVAMVKDSIFAEVYTFIRDIVDERTDVEIAEFHDITYKRVMDYVHFIESPKYATKKELFKNQWKEKHSESLKYFDSIVSGKIKIDIGNYSDNISLKRSIKMIDDSYMSSDLKSRLRINILSLLKMDYFDSEDEFVDNKMDVIIIKKDKLIYDFLESIK